MTENTDEDHVDNTLPEKLPDEIIITKDTATIYTNQETENMEVHHHPDLHHKKKNFKEYFLEFLMIFLAVTLGFFSENIREYSAEKSRAKEMAVSLINDLEKDTVEIDHAIYHMKYMVRNADTVMTELDKPRPMCNDTLLFRNVEGLLHYDFFDPTMGTYEQIKNSGALRYFPQSIASKMTYYEVDKNYILKITDGDLDYYRRSLLPFSEKISNPRFLEALNNKTKYTGPSFNPPLDHETEDLLYKKAFHIKLAYNHQIRIMGNHEKLAIDLMDALQKEYHF